MTGPPREVVEEELRRMLCPSDAPIGSHGRSARIRRLPGDLFAARDLFNDLVSLGQSDNVATYPGDRVKISHGLGYVGIRNVAHSGEPTIDVDVKISGVDRIKKIKFIGWS